jgi:hypothetical protein
LRDSVPGIGRPAAARVMPRRGRPCPLRPSRRPPSAAVGLHHRFQITIEGRTLPALFPSRVHRMLPDEQIRTGPVGGFV